MEGTPDSTSASEGGLDPREAARLLERTRREAERGLDFRSPWLTLLAAAVALVAFGAVWLSVRGQHPYKGPTAAGLVFLYALLRLDAVVVGQAPRQRRRHRALGAARTPKELRWPPRGRRVGLPGGAEERRGERTVVYGMYRRPRS